MSKYITTAISYANGNPHIGHAFEFIIADALSRFHKLNGKNVFFLTGMDEHGQKIQKTAESQNIHPKELCDKISRLFQELDVNLNVNYDRFIRTTENDHKKAVYELFDKCLANGDIYLGEYEGWYNAREETFVSEFDAAQTNYKDPVTMTDYVKMKEPSYFFKLSKYDTPIKMFMTLNPHFIVGSNGMQDILHRLNDQPLRDISISRTSITWGIPLPEKLNNDGKHVFYVWFDALTNYVTGSKIGNNSVWPADVHIIGKDIVWFHAVIWMGMLMSSGYELPRQLCVHGFINDSEGKKMSKSVGNVVSPQDLILKYPSCAIRYYLLKENVLGDVNFSEAGLILAHDTELLAVLGNLINRTFSMFHKYCNSTIPNVKSEELFNICKVVLSLEKQIEYFHIHTYNEIVFKILNDINTYVNDTKIWDNANAEKRDVVLKTLLESFYIIAHFLMPIIPITSEKIFLLLNKKNITFDQLSWENFSRNDVLKKQNSILFNILDKTAFETKKAKNMIEKERKDKEKKDKKEKEKKEGTVKK